MLDSQRKVGRLLLAYCNTPRSIPGFNTGRIRAKFHSSPGWGGARYVASGGRGDVVPLIPGRRRVPARGVGTKKDRRRARGLLPSGHTTDVKKGGDMRRLLLSLLLLLSTAGSAYAQRTGDEERAGWYASNPWMLRRPGDPAAGAHPGRGLPARAQEAVSLGTMALRERAGRSPCPLFFAVRGACTDERRR